MSEEFWNRIAEQIGYDHSHINKKVVGESGEAKFREVLTGKAKNSLVLDVGCADGSFTIDIADSTRHVTGVDNSPKMIERAEQNAKNRGKTNVKFAVMDVENLEFDGNSFDVTYSRRGPGTGSTKSLTECRRVLKPGGMFIEITIGEIDCRDLGKIFGRCQMMKATAVAQKKTAMLTAQARTCHISVWNLQRANKRLIWTFAAFMVTSLMPFV